MTIHLELIPDRQTLDERQRLALFRIYQHSVSNTLRHAQARNLYVRFSITDQMVRLEIEDDGCGFQVPVKWVEMARQGHLGLVGTAERVKSLGGKLEVVSSLGKGTIIRVLVPRRPRETEINIPQSDLNRNS